MQSTLIIFTGLPGTGKTTLSRKIAHTLGLPLIAKDDIKEIMYDRIGWSDKAFSAKLAHATFGIMDHITEQHLKNGLSLMLESNYSPKLANERFQAWQKEYGCTIIQIVCRTDTRVLARRYFERQHTDRHPGHNDNGDPASYEANFKQRIENGEDQPLDVEGPVRIVDTTDLAAVGPEEITEWLQSHISSSAKT
jgi:predicted kinase